MTAPGPKRSGPALLLPCALFVLAILLVLIARVRLLETPLERDEGEYAYIGQLMLEGLPPYGQLAATQKLPGTSAAYAVVMAIFGQTIVGIHIGLLLVNAGAIALTFFLGRRLFGVPAGLAASALYAVLSVDPNVSGIWAHATHFVILPALGGTLLLLRGKGSGTMIASGLLFGLALLMKQPGFVFIVFGAIYVLRSGRLKSALLFLGAAALPYAMTCLILWRAGVFDRFWFWTVSYARQYGSQVTLSAAPGVLLDSAKEVLEVAWGLWLLAGAGLILLWRSYKEHRWEAIFTTVFLVFSFLAVCPGFYFRGHYFVLMLPAVALLAGAGVACGPGKLMPWLAAAVVLATIGWQGRLFFVDTPLQVVRDAYGDDPFPEAIEVSRYIRDHTAKDARIVVLGNEPEIYFYAQRRSVTPYLYTYPMGEAHPFALRMQEEMIHDIESSEVEYVVEDPALLWSWLDAPESHAPLYEWWKDYGPRHFELAGIVDIGMDQTVYRWGAAAVGYKPKASRYLEVYKRR